MKPNAFKIQGRFGSKLHNGKFEDASFRVSTMLDGVGQWLMRSYV